MGTFGPIDLYPSDLQFTVFSNKEIRRVSAVKIITGLTFDTLGYPLPGGLYDSAMGTSGRGEPCTTCLNLRTCPGHIGHIELNVLVYNPFFIKLIQRMINIFCIDCFQIQMKPHILNVLTLQLKLIDAGYITEAQELEMYKSELVYESTAVSLKTENDDDIHPRIAQLQELLQADKSTANKTKTTCALRTALVHTALQRPSNTICRNCQKNLRNVRSYHRRLMYYIKKSEMKEKDSNFESGQGQNKFIFADECRKTLRNIYQDYSELLNLLFPIFNNASPDAVCPVDLLFMDTVLVTPPRTRPTNIVGERVLEHVQTNIYRRIIEDNGILRVIMNHIKRENTEQSKEAEEVYNNTKGNSAYEKLYNAWQSLQSSVDLMLDVSSNRDNKWSLGLKQIIEKKDGIIRKHLMGKRVNFAARTIITPDPNISVDEIGVPDIFARKLSYPVPVTPWNVAELRKMVINGSDIYPGANYIKNERGLTTTLPDCLTKREGIAKLLLNYPDNGIKIVHRHVLNGDVLILNRQPTLHRNSMMGHKVRILQGEKTFRMHYSNCKSYNADFDGDEMNAHYPQSEVARSEAYNIVNVSNNYLVPKDGTPLGGLIQDHVISGVKLSIRGRFFNREDYQQLVYQGLSQLQGNIKLLPPTIIKPIKLWSGKQILSTIIINLIPNDYGRINLVALAKITDSKLITGQIRPHNLSNYDMNYLSEHRVLIKNGELLSGVLDKNQYGAFTYGLVHSFYELYGGDLSSKLLTAFTRVFTIFLQREGFTLGVQDILVNEDAEKKRQQIIKKCREAGTEIVANALDMNEVPTMDILAENLEQAYLKDDKFRILMDRKYKSVLDDFTNQINRTCLPGGLISKFPSNNLQLMIISGAKGSTVNAMQISSLLGQIELEGKRPPLMISGKSLPSFTTFETSPKSGGFIDGRFLTGIQPQDFFFHCMAGREGLIDTAVKTSRSGYLQRCLIKHLEGLTVNYDLTVRDSDKSIVQFLYGEDGLDVMKSKFFNSDPSILFLLHNAKIILRPKELEKIKDENSLLKIAKQTKKINSWMQKHKNCKTQQNRFAPFTQFSAELRHEVEVKKPTKLNKKTGRRRIDEAIVKLWRKANDDSKLKYSKKHTKCPDPITSKFKQDCHYGAVSEQVNQIIKNFKNFNKNRDRDLVSDVMFMKNMKGLAAPGEPVGLLAAQSIGEPSTQMTLNTFHFAGRGEMNVTLGIPRLREILMMASVNIKTPSMDIPIKPNQSKAAEKLRIKLNRVTLADVLQNVRVRSKLLLTGERCHQFELRFQFLPRQAYEDNFCVRPKRILKYMTKVFINQLCSVLLKSSTKKSNPIDVVENDKKKSSKDKENYDDDIDNNDGDKNDAEKGKVGDDAQSSDDDNNDDDDATGIKLKSRKQDERDYDEPDVDEEINDADVVESDNDEDDDNDGVAGNDEDAPNEELVAKTNKNALFSDYSYDETNYLWCKATINLPLRYGKPDFTTILRELAEKSIIHHVTNIKRAIIYKDNDKELLKTDGINFNEMFQYDKILDLNQLYSNHIHAIATTYGIEAATLCIIREVATVFKVYGITVDRRHLSLIADYMTSDGTFKPMSRRGMEHSSSPLLQMSFESSLQFLQNATGSGLVDELNTPSSRLMLGLPVKNGTGAFDLLTKIV